jgi:hypothetical protein
MKGKIGQVWNSEAYDYSSKQIVYDCLTGEIIKKPKQYKHKERLCIKYAKIGCFVDEV